MNREPKKPVPSKESVEEATKTFLEEHSEYPKK